MSRIIIIIIFYFPFIAFCQSDKDRIIIDLPKPVQLHSNFENFQDSLEFAVMITNTKVIINRSDSIERELKNMLLKSIDSTRIILISNYKINLLLETLYSLDKELTESLCINNLNVQDKAEKVGEDFLKHFPFMSFISKKITPIEIIDYILLDSNYNKCLEDKILVKINGILARSIIESFSEFNYPKEYRYNKNVITLYLDFIINKPSIQKNECLSRNIGLLRTDVINIIDKI